MTEHLNEISDLVSIGKLKYVSDSTRKKSEAEQIGRTGFHITLTSGFEHLLAKLNNVFLIFTDHRVRYGKIDILKVIGENKALVNLQDSDLKDELSKEKSVNIALDEDEINSIDDENMYFDPVGMKVLWNEQEVATIKDFFFNGAHDVYEIEMNDKSLILIPDVEAFVIETNTDERFIKVVDLDQFINL